MGAEDVKRASNERVEWREMCEWVKFHNKTSKNKIRLTSCIKQGIIIVTKGFPYI